MAKFLAIFNDAIDDIEINGFIVMSEKDMNNYEDLAYSITWPFSYQLGSEKIHYSSGEDLLSRIEFKEISNEEAKAIKRLFNEEFGLFIDESFLNEVIGEEEDYDDDEMDYDSDDEYDDDEDDDY